MAKGTRGYVGPVLESADWESRNRIMERRSEAARDSCKENRYLAQKEQLDLGFQGNWTEHCSRVELQSRIADVKRMQRTFDNYLSVTKQDGIFLMQLVDKCEHAQDDLYHISEVVRECLTLREERREREMVNDDVHLEIKQVQIYIKSCLRRLQDLCNEAEGQLLKLHDLKMDLGKAVKCQDETIQVDQDQLCLDEASPGVSLKPDPLRQPDGTVSKVVWLEKAQGLISAADAILRQIRFLGDDIQVTLIHIRQGINDRYEALLYALRKRIHEEDQAAQLLQWQENFLSEELSNTSKNVSGVETYRRNIRIPMKLAQTRLENRSERCVDELCFDEAQESLGNEVQVWNVARGTLGQRLAYSRVQTSHGGQMDLGIQLNTSS